MHGCGKVQLIYVIHCLEGSLSLGGVYTVEEEEEEVGGLTVASVNV